MTIDNENDPTRRDFLRTGTAALAAGVVAVRATGEASAEQQSAYSAMFAAPPIETVRVGYVGVGLQGGSHLQNLLKISGCRVTAVCDIRGERTTWATDQIVKAGQKPPAVYNKGPRDFERLRESEDLDLVYTATPWGWHVPVLLAAMRHGKHAAT